MKIGIFFGGSSREREISFAGGRTVYDNLDKTLFEPVPIFVDDRGNFVLLDWQHIYKGSIRDFYPLPSQVHEHSFEGIQIYMDALSDLGSKFRDNQLKAIGQPIQPSELKNQIDFAFLALHGAKGEDGSIQGLLEFFGIPYSGSGIMASAIAMDKAFQKSILNNTRSMVIERSKWDKADSKETIFNAAIQTIGSELICRPANQGSSIGVGKLSEADFDAFTEIVDRAFFVKELNREDWVSRNYSEKIEWLSEICDLRNDLGLPLQVGNQTIRTPKDLFDYLEDHFSMGHETVRLEACDAENEVLVEEFIRGKEFSCIVVKDDAGELIALPPTEIVKGSDIYDYRSKYLPGLARKVTPIDLPLNTIIEIGEECKKLFKLFRFNVYARIDGFITDEGKIILNDPNTTSGMLPSSFFFHQAAEIGLNPSQFLTFIIRNSLKERIEHVNKGYVWQPLLDQLDNKIHQKNATQTERRKVGVILGGYSYERHISVESGRNIYEKLASSKKYDPIPLFLSGDESSFELYRIPIQVLLKDNADDIAEKLKNARFSELTKILEEPTHPIREKYASGQTLHLPEPIAFEKLDQMIDFAFIALHGRPGEDGQLQKRLDQYQIPYNGSGVKSSSITIDKYRTKEILKQNGFIIADHQLIGKDDFKTESLACIQRIERGFGYPLICKPQDDGCSSAVKLIENRKELSAYLQLIFRENAIPDSALLATLKHPQLEPFPSKKTVLIESFVHGTDTAHFLEITGGFLTHWEKGTLRYEVFQPSETLSTQSILSLEEKFLAGEGQNITPARFSTEKDLNASILQFVQKEFERAAKLLEVIGYARIDAFVKINSPRNFELIIIEVNSLPGMTPATCIYHQAALNGYTPFEFIDKIIQFGLQNQKKTDSIPLAH